MIDGGLRRLFQDHLPHVHWQAVETGGVGLGVPDLNGCVDGVEFWLELKQTAGNAVGMRPEQVAWAERRRRAGGRTFVAVRRKAMLGPRRVACDELWLWPGTCARQLLDRHLCCRDADKPYALGNWPGGPARWPWEAVLTAILT